MIVEVEVPVEDVRLDLLLAHALEGGVVTDRDGSRVTHPAVDEPPRVDAVGRDEALRLRRQVRRRVPEFTPALEAVHDDAAHRRLVPEQFGRVRDVPGVEQFPDPRRGHPAPALGHDVVDHDDLEPVLLALTAEHLDIALVAGPVPEVVPDQEHPRVERVDEVPADERLGRVAGQPAVVVQEHRGIQARRGQQFELLPGADELGRRLPGRVERRRVPVERDRDRLEAPRVGDAPQLADDRTVALVHPVELADRHGGRTEVRGDRLDPREGPHSPSRASASAPFPATGWRASHHMPSGGSTSGMNR
ncbi:hypothetical protein GCM10025870_06160 [Agromyces marinus]|uniref:Uncharacterized protein n=1 Tax=Agromyces marinus TaxID=1389020 RepID=A0ABN6YDT8_9MICO|nr:hypothetical protein GCM10025870_06160 [Agromyces marinus]